MLVSCKLYFLSQFIHSVNAVRFDKVPIKHSFTMFRDVWSFFRDKLCGFGLHRH